MLDFMSYVLPFDHTLFFFFQKRPKRAKSNFIFYLNGKAIRGLTLKYLESLVAEFFPTTFLLS